MKFIRKSLVFAVVAVLMLASCKKARLNRETTTAKDNQLAEALSNDVFSVVDRNASANTDGKTSVNSAWSAATGDSCMVITVSTTNGGFPKTMVIDFGSTNCTGVDGKERRGKVIAEIDGKYRDPGTTVSITTENYFVNEYGVDLTKTVENVTTSGNNPTYRVNVSAKIETPDDETIEWVSQRDREWIEGSETGLWTYVDSTQSWTWTGISGITDDVWLITGSGSGTNSEGRDFTIDITTPLRVQWCNYIVEITKGVLEIQPEDLKTRTVDYGDKTCDNKAVVTIGRKEYDVPLRR